MGTNVFQLNEAGDYKIVDYIKSPEEIDKETFLKIKEKYPDDPRDGLSLEMKMLRKGINNPLDPEFVEYNNYVEECRSEGAKKKQAASEALNNLKVIEIGYAKTPINVVG